MTHVNITKAANLVGISRVHLYRKYINHGIISISKDEAGRSAIDISELVRVFGKLHGSNENVSNDHTGASQINNISETILLEKIRGLEALLEAKNEELESYKDREKALYRLLEHKPERMGWWLFGRLYK